MARSAHKSDFLFKAVRITNAECPRFLCLQLPRHNTGATQLIYVQLQASLEADAFTGSGHN